MALTDPALSFDAWLDDAKGSGINLFKEDDEIFCVFCVRSASGSYYFHIRGTMPKVSSQDYFSGKITRIDVCAMRGAVEINYYKNY